MIEYDLAAARESWLSAVKDERQRGEMSRTDFLTYRDSEGRYTDFHALRHSFITMVGKSGVSPREHQDLARHSTYALTSRYSHSRFYDLAAAVQSLPIPINAVGPDSLKATGTDGRVGFKAQRSPKNLGPFLGPQTAISGDSERQSETIDTPPSQRETPEKNAVFASFPGVGAGREKVEPRGIEPLTSALRTLRSPS
jgi:hypothetical protein